MKELEVRRKRNKHEKRKSKVDIIKGREFDANNLRIESDHLAIPHNKGYGKKKNEKHRSIAADDNYGNIDLGQIEDTSPKKLDSKARLKLNLFEEAGVKQGSGSSSPMRKRRGIAILPPLNETGLNIRGSLIPAKSARGGTQLLSRSFDPSGNIFSHQKDNQMNRS